MKKMLCHMVLLLLSLLAVVTDVHAQANAEIPIYNALERKTRPAFVIRNGVEVMNNEAHKSSMKSAGKFRAASDSLGFYYKAFNWVDIGFNSLRFGMNVVNTYNVAKTRMEGITRLLQQYEEECLKHGDLERGDMQIIEIGKVLYRDVRDDSEKIYYTAINVGGYVALKMPCTTYSLLADLKMLNDALEHIQQVLNRAYSRLYFFMATRTGFRWNLSYTPIDRVSVAEGAIGRWRNATQESLNRMAGVTE